MVGGDDAVDRVAEKDDCAARCEKWQHGRQIEVAPDQPAYCDTLGWALYGQGLYAPAVQYLQRAAADKGNAIWTYHLAMAYAKSGDLKRGRLTLQAALKQDPNVPEAKLAQEVIGHGN